MLVSKTETFVKLFFVLSIFGLIMYSVLAFYTFHTALSSLKKTHKNMNNKKLTNERFDNDLKYILLWTVDQIKYKFSTIGQKVFLDNKCKHYNCFLTTDKKMLKGDLTNFDSIIFSIGTLAQWHKNIPKNRSMKQKFVFYSMVPAEENPVCHVLSDNFFNWTWSYKLCSDIVTPFIEVLDLTGKVVAPQESINWAQDLSLPLNMTERISEKQKAVMLYLEECENTYMKPSQLTFVKKLEKNLKEHNLDLDVFGCQHRRCPGRRCLQLLSSTYYFYLVFEASISEDYVTTRVLDAYDNNAVPVIFGGAEYNKFLPPGSYLNANNMRPEMLAATLAYAIKTPTVYNQYFTWKRYYTIKVSELEKGYCGLCEMLNNKKKMSVSSMYPAFRKWWYFGSLKERCLAKGAETYSEIFSYVNDTNSG